VFEPASLRSILFIELQLSKKKVRCLNFEDGCEWTSELGLLGKGLPDHMLLCGHRTFTCPRCDETVKCGDAEQHAEEKCLIRGHAPPFGEHPGKKRKLSYER
jgi:hypothetical protein